MNIAEIKEQLVQRVEQLAQHLFLHGVRIGNNWSVGSMKGEPGQSFKICVAGEKAGLWGDFDGTQKHQRSLLDLWMEKYGVDFKTALRECAQWLGVTVESESVSDSDSEKKAASTHTSVDWQGCVEAFQDKHQKRLAQWRGYSPDFCSRLHSQGLVGLFQDCIAFPVHDADGRVIGCHYRTRTGDWFYTKGCTVHPLIIGNLAEADRVHVFESYWDAFAVCDKLRLHEETGHAVIITRGAGNGAIVHGLIPEKAQVFAWKQNDQKNKNGKRAGDEWLKDVVQSTNSLVKCVVTPASFKDANEWTFKGGAGYEELSHAFVNAKPALKLATRSGAAGDTSLNSQLVSLALDDDYPHPPGHAAFYGLAGEIVRRIEPHTEADPMALLIQFLAAFGNILGHDHYFVADGARHFLILYIVLVGLSSKGRKGTSLNHIANLMERVAAEWRRNRICNGLSSGEGLIWAVRDPVEETKPIREKGRHTGEYETYLADQGESDKRLLVIESEFANVLKVMAREGNTLSPIIRLAWDSGDLRIMTKNSPARATGAHISIIGHITRDELRRLLTQTESANGFANRFCWLAVKRSKRLPDGGAIHTVNFDDIVAELEEVINFAEDFTEIERDPEARKLWHAIYPTLSEGKPGMAGAVTGRAEAQVTRISAIYALLDKSRLVRREHLEAAIALWEYCEQSARWIFGTSTGDRNADKILRALRHAPKGMTKTEISAYVFNRHASSAELDEALRLLNGLKMANSKIEASRGAPIQRWFFSAEAGEISELS
jgi:hypothetical protein